MAPDEEEPSVPELKPAAAALLFFLEARGVFELPVKTIRLGLTEALETAVGWQDPVDANALSEGPMQSVVRRFLVGGEHMSIKES